jgi:hypothetical protein
MFAPLVHALVKIEGGNVMKRRELRLCDSAIYPARAASERRRWL